MLLICHIGKIGELEPESWVTSDRLRMLMFPLYHTIVENMIRTNQDDDVAKDRMWLKRTVGSGQRRELRERLEWCCSVRKDRESFQTPGDRVPGKMNGQKCVLKRPKTRGSQKEGHGGPCEVLELELWTDSHSFDSSLKNPNC